MIQKIQNSEYLKRYDNMTAGERSEYEDRVGQWLGESWRLLASKVEVFEARLQNVLQVSAAWNDQECQVFEEGVRLLSALVNTGETWLPDMLYIKSAKRVIRQMAAVLGSIGIEAKEERAEGTTMATHAVAPFQGNKGDGNITGGNNEGEGKKALGEHSETLATAGTQEDVRGKMDDGSDISPQTQDLVPARPKHIDQYVHLLPKKTQEHAELVQGLYRELDEARKKMDLLMNDKTASPADREAWAKKATKCDNTLRKIFDELDAEWAKLVKSGRVTVDDLGNARVMEEGRGKTDDGNDQEPLTENPEPLTSEQRALRRDLRKWLVDTRRGNGDTREEHVRKWTENFREYLTLEGDAAFKDEKVMEAMKHYGIDLEKK